MIDYKMNGKPKNYSVVTSLLTTEQYLYIMAVYVCTYGLDFSEIVYLSIWLGLPYGVVSAASKPSAGTSWQRLAVGRPISASFSN